MDAIHAMRDRRSIRAFTAEPVTRGQVEQILDAARWAPSGSNIQPWQVDVVTGATRDALCADLLAAHAMPDDPMAHEEYRYYPAQWREPYLARRRATGWGLYGLLGIGRADKVAMARQLARNFTFFDAPVGLLFSIDRDLEVGSWFDYGMFVQNVMLAARAIGLETCPQQAFARYHRIVRRHVDLPESRVLICGMALGHPDRDAPENALRTERETVAGFSRFHGFDAAAAP
jgi:nitroreductase